jgi:putative N6-adenine-specific DNA methylase
VIFNPPYGERIELGVNEFYEKVGDTLKKNFINSTVWLISSDIENLKMIGLKPTKKIELMNSNLKCSFREFKIYPGSKKAKYLKDSSLS